uniref:Uncharacterized protein n=1 Tax=Opuntia streptacantha TaxID=393608 RepID=A0A7C8YNK4_OPUST
MVSSLSIETYSSTDILVRISCQYDHQVKQKINKEKGPTCFLPANLVHCKAIKYKQCIWENLEEEPPKGGRLLRLCIASIQMTRKPSAVQSYKVYAMHLVKNLEEEPPKSGRLLRLCIEFMKNSIVHPKTQMKSNLQQKDWPILQKTRTSNKY